MKNFGVISNSTRLSPTTYLGWTGAVNYGPSRCAARTSKARWIVTRRIRNASRPTADSTLTISPAAIFWQSEHLNMQYGYGESDNYLRRHILFTNIKPIKALNIGTQVYATHALDEYKAMPANKRDFDDDAWHIAMDVKWQADNWSTKWGLGYTDANKANEVGFYPRHMSKKLARDLYLNGLCRQRLYARR